LVEQFDVLAGSLLHFQVRVALEGLDHFQYPLLELTTELVVQLEQGRQSVLDGLISSSRSEQDLLNKVDNVIFPDFDLAHSQQGRGQFTYQVHGHFAESVVP
jgi:hypothetical protein